MDVQKEFYCGVCGCDAGVKAGSEGKWQAYGDASESTDGKKQSWIFLCRGCLKNFWRDHNKLEEYPDDHTKNCLFVKNLGIEIARSRGFH